jgi:hypothetical protein
MNVSGSQTRLTLFSRWYVSVPAIVVAANVVFVLLLLLAPAPAAQVSERIREGFAAGDLARVDYRAGDVRRGYHQYNDCLILQMLSNDNTSRHGRALAPLTYNAEPLGGQQCVLLQQLSVSVEPVQALQSFSYSRYWHGYNAVAGFGLRYLTVAGYRSALILLAWTALAILLLAAMRAGPNVRITAGAIGTGAASLWALPYFAPNFSHGPGDALLLLGVAGIALRPQTARNLNTILPYAAAFGSLIVYFEMLTGQLPIGAAWLGAITLAAWRDGEGAPEQGRPIALTSLVLLAFSAGAVGSVVLKQSLALVLADPGASAQFAHQLRYYMAIPDFEPGWPGLLEPFGRLVRQSRVLTYDHQLAGYLVVGATGGAWLAAAVRCLRSSQQQRHAPHVLVMLALALAPVPWVLLLPYHTYVHAPFMVRMLIVPITLSMAALLLTHVRSTSTAQSAVDPAACEDESLVEMPAPEVR